MDTQNSPVADVPDLKLAKVGAKRDKKRGAGGWLSGGRGAGSAFSGATGGAGAGGGIFGAGMSIGKLLTILFVAGGLSAGAWTVGNMMSSNSAGAPAPKVFADKGGPQKYSDLSGIINGGDKTIPNSLGYVNNDGLTDEQRAAKKAAEDAAAAKAAADAQAKADAEAKEKALADAKAASATPDPTAQGQSPASPKLGAMGARFGAMKSSFGGSGGGLSGGAGLSGGINRGFASMGGLDGAKAKAGALSAFRSPAKAASTVAASPTRGHSNAKGFAKQQLDMANGLSRTAAATGKSETASAGAATPFDNNGAQGSVISGPGIGNGTQTGPADGGGTTNPSSGLGGPIGSGAACSDPNMEPGPDGVCNTVTQTPTGQNADPNQWIYNVVEGLMAVVALLSIFEMYLASNPVSWVGVATIGHLIGVFGALICAMGMLLIAKSGDIMRGGIITAIGGFITAVAFIPGILSSTETFTMDACATLIASALGAMASASSGPSMKAGAMQ